MARYDIAEAKARWSETVRKAFSGEDVIIARDNRPLLMLVPLMPVGGYRGPGFARGRTRMAADFDPTPDDFAEYTT